MVVLFVHNEARNKASRVGDRRYQEGQRDELQLDHGRPHGGRVPDEDLVVSVHLDTDETQNVDPQSWLSTHDASWATNNNNNNKDSNNLRARVDGEHAGEGSFQIWHTAVPTAAEVSQNQIMEAIVMSVHFLFFHQRAKQGTTEGFNRCQQEQ